MGPPLPFGELSLQETHPSRSGSRSIRPGFRTPREGPGPTERRARRGSSGGRSRDIAGQRRTPAVARETLSGPGALTSPAAVAKHVKSICLKRHFFLKNPSGSRESRPDEIPRSTTEGQVGSARRGCECNALARGNPAPGDSGAGSPSQQDRRREAPTASRRIMAMERVVATGSRVVCTAATA